MIHFTVYKACKTFKMTNKRCVTEKVGVCMCSTHAHLHFFCTICFCLCVVCVLCSGTCETYTQKKKKNPTYLPYFFPLLRQSNGFLS